MCWAERALIPLPLPAFDASSLHAVALPLIHHPALRGETRYPGLRHVGWLGFHSGVQCSFLAIHLCIDTELLISLQSSWNHRHALDYCFFASNWLVVPCSVSVTATVKVLPSGDTVFLAIPITFPSRLSVSSKEFLPVRLTDTLVVPGSPL
jgi:hypothetical protein